MAANPLEEAERLYARRRWRELIDLLEPLASLYRESARYAYLLGSAYLHREDLGGAYSCFRRAQQLDFRDADVAAGLAAVYIRRGEGDKAIQLYIDALERNPRDPLAKKGLSYMRACAASDSDPASMKKLKALYPRPKRSAAPIVAVVAIAAAIGAATLLWPLAGRLAEAARPIRPGVSEVNLSDAERRDPVGSQGGFSFVLTHKEALDAFDRAKELFLAYRDEAALVEVNRIKLSNASDAVKAKADILVRYAREPSFLSLPDKFGFDEVSKQPALYEGVAVAWRGLAANVESGPGFTRFELLVGYHDGQRRLEGIVQVRLPFEASLQGGEAVEALGLPRLSSAATAGFYLDGVAIHRF